MPNQDSFSYSQFHNKENSIYMMSIADGHGSAPHPYSAEGALFATQVAYFSANFFLQEVPIEKIKKGLLLHGILKQ